MTQITSSEQLRKLLGKPHKLVAAKISDHLSEQMIMFLRQSPLMFLATVDEHGIPTVSPKGDPAGFMHIQDSTTVLIPERPGNKLMMGFGNILANPGVGLIAVVPGTEETVRINGTARLLNDPVLNERFTVSGKPALLVIEVKVTECFLHCAKAFKRSKAWQPEQWAEPVKLSMSEELIDPGKSGNKLKRRAMKAAVDLAVEQDYRKNLY